MSDLYELLAQTWSTQHSASAPISQHPANDELTRSYLDRLSSLSLESLKATEPASLLHATQSHARNLQALSKRSHRAVIASSSQLTSLGSVLPSLSGQAKELYDSLPQLEAAATEFAAKYDRSTENMVLDRRKRAMLLSRNVDRVSDVLDLPSLLSSTVSSAQHSSNVASSSAASYASALDLHAHIKRLNVLYPKSELIANISKQGEIEMQNLTTILITSLQSPSLKLAAAMRIVGHLRRVAPDLAEDGRSVSQAPATSTKSFNLSRSSTNADGALGSLFLTCRLRTLHNTLEALEPLRDLADQETAAHRKHLDNGVKQLTAASGALGTQSERYLKRYVEIFREQSFNIVSMYKSIFPTGFPSPEQSDGNPLTTNGNKVQNPLLPLPSSVSTFTMHCVDMLMSTLRDYMPNIKDKTARESLLTQILYCAGSLGRLGADFGVMTALLEEDLADGADEDAGDAEWAQVMKKHRIQASRLEVLAKSVGSGRKGSMEVTSPTALPAG